MLPEIQGKEIFRHVTARTTLSPGVATALSWTPAGGHILFIEGTFMPGTGKFTLTGQLGDVMKESANYQWVLSAHGLHTRSINLIIWPVMSISMFHQE